MKIRKKNNDKQIKCRVINIKSVQNKKNNIF